MNVSQAVDFHLQYHQANSKKNLITYVPKPIFFGGACSVIPPLW